jgi:hypothetical protein
VTSCPGAGFHVEPRGRSWTEELQQRAVSAQDDRHGGEM